MNHPDLSVTPRVVASFTDTTLALAVVQRMLGESIPRDQIFIVAPEDEAAVIPEDLRRAPDGERAPISAVAGSSLAGTVAALGGMLVGMATGGTVLIVAGALAGAGAGGIVGGLIGAMAGRATEGPDRDFYDQALREGAVLVGVVSDDAATRAAASNALSAAGGTVVTLGDE